MDEKTLRLREPEVAQALSEWASRLAADRLDWRESSPTNSFHAGWRAAMRFQAEASALFRAIVNSDDAHWTPAMRAAMAKATGAWRALASAE